jgi:hypothetical protein
MHADAGGRAGESLGHIRLELSAKYCGTEPNIVQRLSIAGSRPHMNPSKEHKQGTRARKKWRRITAPRGCS